ncbi:MAG: insulinase family protein [Gammaproteobacteria bacterium]|nr:insulinase family protein [Gammaproteobacteria bacterium]
MLKAFGWVLLVLFASNVIAENKVSEYVFDNGLRLIVKEDHRAPVMVSQIWYKVGSSYELDGHTGISHVLEHMMFKGTDNYEPGEFSRIIARNGGRENAFTGRDYTAYFQRMEKSRIEVSFKLESDRMHRLKLQEKEFVKEVQVVMEERRMRTEDKPKSLTREHFNATAFMNSSYRNPVIGWQQDLEEMELDDLREWYRLWYAPNNALIVVVGDVDPDAVYALAKKYFSAIPAVAIKPAKKRTEVKQRGLRRIEVHAEAKLPFVMMGYKVPVLRTAENTEDAYALEVLAWILDGGDGARMSRSLVRGSQVAATAGAGYDLYARQQSLLILQGVPANGHTINELEQALREQIALLREQPVTLEELRRAKAQVVADAVYEKDSMFYQAMQIGMLEASGLDWQQGDDYVKRIQAVTVEQIQQAARDYLIENNLTIATLVPETTAASTGDVK